MKLLLFAASHRKDSLNRKLAVLAAAYLKAQGVEAELAEYADFDMPLYNDEIAREKLPAIAHVFAQRTKNINGIVICSPEYNWSHPGSLKNIIDWTSRIAPKPMVGKTALLMSVTPGSRGGITGLQHLKMSLEALQMFVFPKMLPLGNADNAFDSNGKLVSAKQQAALATLLDDFIAFTRKLSA